MAKRADCSRLFAWLAWLAWLALLAGCWSIADGAAAQQVVLLDQLVMLARDTPNLSKSEYSVFAKDFAHASPASLRAPVNYAEGRIHVRLEVLEKPSAADTLFTLCIHNDAHQTCIRYLPKFTAPGVYEYDQPMLGQYNYDLYDFAKPVTRVIVAFKDGMERLLDPALAGFDAYFPVQFRVTMALVAKGASYVPPAAPPRDAGIGAPVDAGMSGGSQDASAPAQPDAGQTSSGGRSVVIVDQRLVATAQLAANAKVPLSLTPQTPASLRTPVDFGSGKLHARVEVLSKPSGAPTQLRACLENAAGGALCSAALAGQSYVSASAIDHEEALASMQSAASYDFGSPVRRAYLQVTDAFGASVAGNAQFFPTELKATFTLLGPGASYVPPWETRPDAGGTDGGASPTTGGADDAEGPPAAGDAGRTSDAGASAGTDAESAGSPDAGGAGDGAHGDDGQDDAGCTLSAPERTAQRSWTALAALALALACRRRRRY